MITLFEHQSKALRDTAGKNRVAYYLDMGLGKTFVGSEKMKQLGNRVNLVICQKSKIPDWIEHFEQYYSYRVYNLTITDQFFEFFGKAASGQFWIVGIINYELAWRREEISDLDNFTLMLDESSLIQNENAKQSKFILNCLCPTNVILLSGTPTDGKYERLWSQIRLLGWDISKKLYWQHYIETEWLELDDSGFKTQIVTGYKNVDRLKAKLAEHGAVFMKSDEAFTLPAQTEIPIMLSATQLYRQFQRKDIVTTKSIDTGNEVELIGDTTLTHYLYSRQLCSQYNPKKLEAYEDLLLSTNDRLIVFYNFDEELRLLLKTTKNKTEHISVVNGKQKDLDAYSRYSDSVTFVQYQAGAMGLNLQKANHMIFYSLTDKSALFEQAKKRIHRIGQKQPCFYYFFICNNTVEEKILENLKLRKDYTDELFKKERMKK